MKNLLILFVSVLFISCGDSPSQKKETVVTIPDSLKSTTIEGEEILMGKITLAQLDLFSPWYAKEYEFYKINASQDRRNKTSFKRHLVCFVNGNLVRRQSTRSWWNVKNIRSGWLSNKFN